MSTNNSMLSFLKGLNEVIFEFHMPGTQTAERKTHSREFFPQFSFVLLRGDFARLASISLLVPLFTDSIDKLEATGDPLFSLPPKMKKKVVTNILRCNIIIFFPFSLRHPTSSRQIYYCRANLRDLYIRLCINIIFVVPAVNF